MGDLRKMLTMDPGPERDNLLKKYGRKIEKPNYKNHVPTRFEDEPKPIRIKAHPLERGKNEAQITRDHELFCIQNNILYFHTKAKGEPQMIGGGRAILKKSQNAGFFDMILLIKAKIFVGLELKHGDGGVWAAHQKKYHDLVVNAGGYALVSNSVHITYKYLKDKNLL